MLSATTNHPLKDTHWRRINMRKVAHIAAAESLHNLYNRHWPRINSIRFRHTITNCKDGIVESFAPNTEWAFLQHWLSKKFVSVDPILIREIEAILKPTYDIIDELMARIDTTDLTKQSNEALALLFIDVMDYPLGEIYRLNVVQIEYSLNYALHTILKQYEPNAEERNLLLSKLIAPGELTVAQEEEVHFANLIKKARRAKAPNPYRNATIKKAFLEHVRIFAPKHCAYGELPPTEQDYLQKFTAAYRSTAPLLTRPAALHNLQVQVSQSKQILKHINDPALARLCKLMARIGVFRDGNKAKMGETVVRRFRLLDEIANRTSETRAHLDLYLISEIVILLDADQKVPGAVLRDRKKNGITFKRNEDVHIGITQLETDEGDRLKHRVLPGICASSGYVEGPVKIIFTKDDISKMQPGDIMVAIGTDFDLIEIMNRSAGIITEEGGLLSHASVVSRELKKPCLIGVENATKVLHDGNRVKLDAIGGQLEIIS